MGCNSSANVATAPRTKQEFDASAASTQRAGSITLLTAPASGEKKKQVDSADEVTLIISFLNGQQLSLATRLDATLGDLKAKISKETGHTPGSQRLSLGATPLADSSKPLKDLGVTGASPLSLVVVREPIGQSSLAAPEGKKASIIEEGNTDEPFPKEMLNEFEFMSWQAVCTAHESQSWSLFMEWNEDYWPDLGCYGVDLYWTTRSDGCRYEYWSAGPGDNEYGVLVRVGNEAMTAIGMGSDDGLEFFQDCEFECDTNDVLDELVKEGWPRWQREESDDDEEQSEDDDKAASRELRPMSIPL